MEFVQKHKVAVTVAIFLILAVIVGLVIQNSVTNTGNRKEATLNAQYPNNANYLSDCVVRIRETAGVATGQKEALNEIIEDAVKGRYSEGSSAQVGQGALFSAIVEEYPDLSGLSDSFGNVMTVVNGCRTDYRGQQTLLLDKIRDYDTWRTGSFTVRTLGGGFPSDNLRAQAGEESLRGEAALEKMRDIVLVGEAREAYETGVLEAEDPFGANSSNEGEG